MDTPEDATKDSPSTRTNVSSARVRHVRRVSSSSTLERSARGGGERRAQREEEQEVDEEIPKFLGDEDEARRFA